MTSIAGISGSLRRGSFNTSLLSAAAALMPEGAGLAIHTLHGIPLYNADTEAAEGIPASVAQLKEQIAAADGLLIATPEYNNSIPGVVKNAFDWLSRPPSDIRKVFGGKPVALAGASPGGFGTVLSQNAWLGVLRALGARPWFGARMAVSRAQGVFDQDGNLTDETVRRQLADFLGGFVLFIRTGRS
jgi:NAD(P)H-dependent FMN reductase